MFLICHMNLREHIFKGSGEIFMWKPLTESHLPMFGGHWPRASKDINYLICHMTPQNHAVDGSCNFLNGCTSWYVTTLPVLVATGIMVVEIQCF